MNINDIVTGLRNFNFGSNYIKYNNNKKSIIGGGIYTNETSIDSIYLKPSQHEVTISDTNFDTVTNINTIESETSIDSAYLKPYQNDVNISDTSFDTVTDINTKDSETSIDSAYLKPSQNDVTISDTSVDTNSNNLFIKNNTPVQTVIDSDLNFVNDIMFNGIESETIENKVLINRS
jgi:hypothetical protein|uniref:Uncharacterized protein n=1 Tax=viral metagenome TaxID=1070528 RepID=A0A6C0IV64_9ZZZZ